MFPSKSRDGRAANGDAAGPTSPAEVGTSVADERMSHLQPKYQDLRTADRSTVGAAPPIGEDPGALLIGGGVELKGRIGSCDALVVEGTIKSTVVCRTIEIRASGVVTGEATVENATIVGRFDGTLVVTGCLTVHAGGRISGSVRYGEIEIERGAEISGDVATVATETPVVSASMTEHAMPPRDPTAEELEARVVLGVDRSTIQRDLDDGSNEPLEGPEPATNGEEKSDNGSNEPPESDEAAATEQADIRSPL